VPLVFLPLQSAEVQACRFPCIERCTRSREVGVIIDTGDWAVASSRGSISCVRLRESREWAQLRLASALLPLVPSVGCELVSETVTNSPAAFFSTPRGLVAAKARRTPRR